MFQLTPMVKNILIINIGIFALTAFLSLDLAGLFGVRYLFSENFYVFQYVTYMWLHGDFYHVLFNMIGVLVFGPMLERVWGSKRFLIFYLATGIGAGVLYGAIDTVDKIKLENDTKAMQVDPNPDDFYIFLQNHGKGIRLSVRESWSDFADVYYENEDSYQYRETAVSIANDIYKAKTLGTMIGASGALFGILLAFGMLFPNTELMLLFPPIPIKAKYLVFAYGAYALYNVINTAEGDNVAHLAHLTGMLTGYILLKIWQKQRGNFY